MIKEQTIINYIGKLKHDPKHKIFGNYRVKFEALTWARNLIDGYNAHLYDKQGIHVDSIIIDMNKYSYK